MLAAFAQLLVSGAAVVASAVLLTRCADRVAEITKLGRLLIGTIMLASLTSLPEMGVGVSAALQDHVDIAVGGVMGSSLMNLLILAVLDLSVLSRGRMLSRASAAHALSGTMALLLTGIAVLALSARLELAIGPMGLGTLAILAAWLFGNRLVFFDQRYVRGVERGRRERPSERIVVPRKRERRRELLRALAGSLATAAAILVAAPFFSDAAAEVAELTGLGDTFVGTTMVALATSLPEVATTLSALRIGQPDLAIGNVYGSNAFNMATLAPVDLASDGALLSNADAAHAATGAWVIVVTAVAIVGQLYHVERRRKLLDPDALLMLILIVLALASTYGR